MACCCSPHSSEEGNHQGEENQDGTWPIRKEAKVNAEESSSAKISKNHSRKITKEFLRLIY